MGCELHCGEKRLNWSKPSYWIMAICRPFNPKTPEFYEFDDSYYPEVPTYQTGIAPQAVIKALSTVPEKFTDLPDCWRRLLSEDEFTRAMDFLRYCAEHQQSILCSH